MRLFVVLALVVLLHSCKDNAKEEATSQMEQVMMIHDEVMPKMGKLSKLVADLKSKVDTTEQGKKI